MGDGLTTDLTMLVIGSISRDLLPGGGASAGGVPHWAGLALLQLGARVRVLTRAAEADYALLDALRRAGAEVLCLPSAATTTCASQYGAGGDRHELWAFSDPIGPVDVPAHWRKADAVQLGPLHPHDLAPGLARALEGRIGLDAQGLVRAGRGIDTHLAAARDLRRHLAGVEVLKASESELPFLPGAAAAPAAFMAEHGIHELLITRAARGARVFSPAGSIEIPAIPVVVRHPVGAGDVFLAAYLFGRACGASPAAAARLASRASAAKIESGTLPADLASREDGT